MPNYETLGPIQSFDDVVVVPYEVIIQRRVGTPMEHEGGPILPDWDRQTRARFCRNGVPADTLPVSPPITSRHIDGAFIWGGPCASHFGHQVAEFSTRILHGISALPELPLLLAPSKYAEISKLEDTPSFFRSILDWYGVSPERVNLVVEPTRIGELHIPPQAEQLRNIGPPPGYLDLLDGIVERKLGHIPKQGTIYVSRAGLPDSLAGESYIEELLARAGIQPIRPERLSLEDQLRCYQSAARLIFAEGSALHGLQLLGRNLGDITVLQRRPQRKIVHESLQCRARSINYVDVLSALVYGTRSDGSPRLFQALSLLSEDKLVDFLRSLDSRIVEHWSSERYQIARDEDVKRWLDTEARRAMMFPRSTETTVERLAATGLEHMVPYARAHLPQDLDESEALK